MLRCLDHTPLVTHTHTHTNTHTHTKPIGLPWTYDQLVTQAVTYTTHNIPQRRIFIASEDFEPAFPVIKRPQTSNWDRTATGFNKIIPTVATWSSCDDSVYKDWRLLGCDIYSSVVRVFRRKVFTPWFECFVGRFLLHGQGRIVSLNRLFYCISLHSFSSYFLLPTPFFTLLPISPVFNIPCQFTQLQFWFSLQMLGQFLFLT
jgi:hypothetical protein